jgi:dTDP-4-amino-4,6-dideoxygalactose transaminase
MVTGAGPIPLVDLAAQHREVGEEIQKGFARVMADSAFVQGEDLRLFEAEFADFCGAEHCVGVANGTDALELALRAVGVADGDEVILPTNSFVATAEAVVRAGAIPVLVDADPQHLLIDVDQVAGRIGPRTKAILPVHLYGQMAPMERLVPLAAACGAVIVEDAAQAHGATRNGTPMGGFGAAAGTSFYPGKNLGAYGDAGAVVTNSDEIARRIRALGNHGGLAKYEHAEIGFNSRLDTLQAVVLRIKLRRLAAWNGARRQAAARYDALLASLPDLSRPLTLEGNEHVYHLYVVRVPGDRDAVLRRLREHGIGAGVHYPAPIHRHGAFRGLGHAAGDFPVAEQAAGELLSLPLHPHLTAGQQERVVETLAQLLD